MTCHLKNCPAFLISVLVLLLLPLPSALSQEKAEETYSISLVQTAEVEKDKQIQEIDDKKVLTEAYTVKRGDHLWQLFRERDMLGKRNLPELLAILKRLNKSLTNLDLIHPGERIVIPLTFSPVAGLAKSTVEAKVPLEALKDVKLENYTVKPGDSLIKVVKKRYQVTDQELPDEYLRLLERLNPEIEDLNVIQPGQVVRLPVYHAELVRVPIEPGSEAPLDAELTALSRQMMDLFSLLGEEWVNTGEHFIPLKSGGQINLKADTFPILNLVNGIRGVVDLYNALPDKIAELISSSWENYRIVHIAKGADLRGALDKVLSVCNYQKIYRNGEPLELGGDIPLRMTADWIIKPLEGGGKTILVMIEDSPGLKIPQGIKDFMETLDIRIVEYPAPDDTKGLAAENPEILTAGPDPSDLVEFLLNLTGQSFYRNAEIRVYQGDRTDFNLLVNASYLLDVNGKDCVIDFAGLGKETLSLLKERRFSVLPLAGEKDPYAILSKTLALLGVGFDSQPHPFMATAGNESRNIRLTIPGMTFKDKEGRNIFASHLSLPDQLAGFLSSRGYRILSLPRT